MTHLILNIDIEDTPETLDETTMKDMIEKFNQTYENYQHYEKLRRRLIRFIPIKSFLDKSYFTTRDLDDYIIRYYWNGNEYVRRLPNWHPKENLSFRYLNEEDRYEVVVGKYYVYMSYDNNSNFYIGSYTCFGSFDTDGYYGSFTDKSFKPVGKVLLCECKTRDEAYEKESILHTIMQVDKNNNFINKVIEDRGVLLV